MSMTREEIALNIACDLLTGSVLYGYDYDRIFNEIMERDGVVSMLDIKAFILDHVEELGKEYFVEEADMRKTGNVAYICKNRGKGNTCPSNGQPCSYEICNHTTDIKYAKNFVQVDDGKYEELDTWKDGEPDGEHQT